MWSAGFLVSLEVNCLISKTLHYKLLRAVCKFHGEHRNTKLKNKNSCKQSTAIKVSPLALFPPSCMHFLLSSRSLLGSLSLIYHRSLSVHWPCQNGSVTSSIAEPALGCLFKALQNKHVLRVLYPACESHFKM